MEMEKGKMEKAKRGMKEMTYLSHSGSGKHARVMVHLLLLKQSLLHECLLLLLLQLESLLHIPLFFFF
jgi:hypothetical protein